MIENDTEMRPYQSTYDGSLWGDDVCRCGSHVDPHRHTDEDPLGKSIYEEGDDDSAEPA